MASRENDSWTVGGGQQLKKGLMVKTRSCWALRVIDLMMAMKIE